MKAFKVVAVAAGLLLAGAPWAAAEHHEHTGHDSAAAKDGACEKCETAMKDLESINSKLEEAKKSDEITKVRALISEAQASLTAVKEHAATCAVGGKSDKAGVCPMCNVKLGEDGKCPHCGMKP